MKWHLVLAISIFLSAPAYGKKGGKADPTACPCFDLMTDLAAQSGCTSFVNDIRVGKGKRGTIKRLLWIDHVPENETDPDTIFDTDTCYLVDVNTPESRVDTYSGYPNGGSTCWYVTNIPDRPDPPRCTVNNLADEELKACFSTFDIVRNEVNDLPDCPEPADP